MTAYLCSMWVWKASVESDKEKFGLPPDYLILWPLMGLTQTIGRFSQAKSSTKCINCRLSITPCRSPSSRDGVAVNKSKKQYETGKTRNNEPHPYHHIHFSPLLRGL